MGFISKIFKDFNYTFSAFESLLECDKVTKMLQP